MGAEQKGELQSRTRQGYRRLRRLTHQNGFEPDFRRILYTKPLLAIGMPAKVLEICLRICLHICGLPPGGGKNWLFAFPAVLGCSFAPSRLRVRHRLLAVHLPPGLHPPGREPPGGGGKGCFRLAPPSEGFPRAGVPGHSPGHATSMGALTAILFLGHSGLASTREPPESHRATKVPGSVGRLQGIRARSEPNKR